MTVKDETESVAFARRKASEIITSLRNAGLVNSKEDHEPEKRADSVEAVIAIFARDAERISGRLVQDAHESDTSPAAIGRMRAGMWEAAEMMRYGSTDCASVIADCLQRDGAISSDANARKKTADATRPILESEWPRDAISVQQRLYDLSEPGPWHEIRHRNEMQEAALRGADTLRAVFSDHRPQSTEVVLATEDGLELAIAQTFRSSQIGR